ncbi:MAG: iron donor protein CyaY [Planctomycetota bacterium]
MRSTLDESGFRTLSDECLARFVRYFAEFDPDQLDFRESDGVLSLEFADGTRYVLNRQAATRQMWYAAGARAWHYDWCAERRTWLDDRDGHELAANVLATVGTKLARALPALNSD